MSGYGGGIYWLVYKISNAGVQPTWRPGAANISAGALNGFVPLIYGITQQITTLNFGNSWIRGNNAAGSLIHLSSSSTFDNPYASNINTSQSSSTTLTGNVLGFLLHTVDF